MKPLALALLFAASLTARLYPMVATREQWPVFDTTIPAEFASLVTRQEVQQ